MHNTKEKINRILNILTNVHEDLKIYLRQDRNA